jgi:hypothetical protein
VFEGVVSFWLRAFFIFFVERDRFISLVFSIGSSSGSSDVENAGVADESSLSLSPLICCKFFLESSFFKIEEGELFGDTPPEHISEGAIIFIIDKIYF